MPTSILSFLQVNNGGKAMPFYIVDRKNYVVHERECPKVPTEEDEQFPIGFHLDGSSAVKYIKSYYTHLDFKGGKCCCRSCYKKNRQYKKI